MTSRPIRMDLADSEPLKRGSMYQSSKEVRRTQKIRDRRSEALDSRNNAFLSSEIIDSPWYTSKEAVCFPQPSKEDNVSLKLEPKSSSPVNVQLLEFLNLSSRGLSKGRSKISISSSDAGPTACSSADFLFEICLAKEDIRSLTGNETQFVDNVKVKEIKFGAQHFVSDAIGADIVHGRNSICILPKSFSLKVGPLNTFYHSGSLKVGPLNTYHHSEGGIMKSRSNAHFSRFKKMLNPAMKSRSLHDPEHLEPETSSDRASDAPCETQMIEYLGKSNGRDQMMKRATLPAHLHAVLRWDTKHDATLYEFSVKDPEKVLHAKTWKTANAFNWVYTFHCCKKVCNAHGHGKKERHDHLPPVIAQMQVSSYLCSEVSGGGSFDNSAITEFTLYDIALARRSNALVRDHLPSRSNQTAAFTIPDNCHGRRNSSDSRSESSTSYPWMPGELKPNFEIAAILIQTPFSKKGNLKELQAGDEYISGKQCSSKYSAADQTRVAIGTHSSLAEVKVITPIGRHGLPNNEEVGPSSLLDRWRFGGSCDCGGWDMGCPILVFDSVNYDNAASVIRARQPFVLLAKGKREKFPAVTITFNGEGQYAVDFHAQLSALQAFSVCIAILHGCEASSAIGQDKSPNMQSGSLKLLLEDEVRHIIEAVAGEEKRKVKKRAEQLPPSFFLDPPFSPIGRV